MGNSCILKNCNIIDGTGADLQPNGTVLIENGVIKEISFEEQYTQQIERQYQGFQVIDISKKYLIPGLIDSHIHVHGYAKTDPTVVKLWHLTTAPMMKMMHAVHNLKLLLEAGFTTVRHCGILTQAMDVHLREAVKAQLIMGPRILACGHDISMIAGHGDLFTPPWAMYQPGLTADGIDECIKAVRQRLREGVDFIKIHSSGGIMSEGDPLEWRNYRVEEVKAICDEAHDFGLKVAAHAHGTEGIKIALKGGVDTIEHGTYMDDEGRELMLEKGAYLVPTLATSGAVAKSGLKTGAPASSIAKGAGAYEQAKINFRKAYEAGVKIANGSDCFNLLRVRYNRQEFDELFELNIPTIEIIQIATRNAADALDILNETGTIEKGKDADLVVLKKNPLDDIAVLGSREETEYVFRKGEILVENH